MENFKKSLNAKPSELKEKRVINFCDNAKEFALTEIQNIRREIRTLENEREQLLDLGESQTTSIASRLASVNPEELMKKVFKLGFQIKEKHRLLDSMVADYKILFGTSSSPENGSETTVEDAEMTIEDIEAPVTE